MPNEREAEGFVRKLSKKTPQSARSGCQLPFQGSQGGFAARVARLATPTPLILLTMRSYIFNSCNQRAKPFYLLAFCRIMCYAIPGATSTPVGGSPSTFSGVMLLFTPNPKQRGGGRCVRYME